jgi:ABC-type transport system involved in multi-copper enzyme maturation permease subunit
MGRWGFGPVFAYEWLTTSRRWQFYVARALFVGVLLVGLTCVWVSRVAGRNLATIAELARVGQSFFSAIVFIQLIMVLVAAPAATAGGICQDKMRGNLMLLLATDLSDAEIILGKLAARLVSILGLTCCALPVLALGALLGGIDPLALAGSFLVTLGVAVLGCAIALTLSIWGTKPYEVLLATYAILGVWLLAMPVWEFFTWLRGFPPLPGWAIATNPVVLAFAPYARPGTVGVADFVGFVAAALAISAALVVFAIARMRSVIVGHQDQPAGRRPTRGVLTRLGGWSRPGIGLAPSLERNPALWYEWHRKQPSPWIRTLIRLYFALAIGFTVFAIEDSVRPVTPFRGWFPAYVTAFQVVVGLPLLLIAAATALVEERVRGSLDVLLATPLSTRSIVLAKWWSVFGQSPRLLLLPAVLAAVLARDTGNWPTAALFLVFVVAAAAAWTSIGLALSTWIPRLGRAVSASVALYTFISLGWPIMGYSLFADYQVNARLSLVSPFYGSFFLTLGIEQPDFLNRVVAWGLAWTIAIAVVAALVLLATLATFNRCFGRVPEREAG